MSLPRLVWKKAERAALGGSTVADILTALKTLCESGGAMFADGWTCEVDDPGTIQGLALKPPAAAVSELRIIFAGKAASIGTPTMLAPDTATTANVLIGISKGITVETFGSFDDANPMGGGTFSGYWRGFGAGSATHITVFYSDEALCVMIDNNTNGTMRYIVAGAFLDMHSTTGGDVEASERVYSIACCGSVVTGINRALDTATANNATLSGWFVHGTSDGNAHFGSFQPGAGTWQTVQRPWTMQPSLFGITQNGARILLPATCDYDIDGSFAGRLREIHGHTHAIHAVTKLKTGGANACHIGGASLTADSYCVAFSEADNS